MGDIQAILEKVAKLRRLAKSDNVNEAAAAAAAADRIIQEHGLQEAQLEAAGETPSESPEQDPTPVTQWAGKVPTWSLLLVHNLTRHYGCAGYREWVFVNGSRGQAWRIVGRPSDVATVRYMWAWLSAEIDRLAAQHRGKGRSWIDSFRKGAVAGIREKMAESTQATKSATTGVSSAAMVLHNGRAAVADQRMRQLVPNLSKGGGQLPGARDGNAYHSGKQAGRNIHVGASLGGGSSKGALGQ